MALYGRSLPLTNITVLSVLFLAKSLSCTEIAQCSHNVVTSWEQTIYINPVATILSNLRCDVFKDHEIIFHDFSLKIHKFFFASISPYFKAKFTKQWLDSNDTTSDFSKLLQVSPSLFSNFFTSFYNGKLEVNLENAFEYSHLAWYFQLSELEKFVEDFILNSKAEYHWVTSLVLKAINCEDYLFIKIVSTKISEIQDLSSYDPIPVYPLFFQNLTSNIDVSWLLRYNVWTPQILEKSIETIKFDNLPIDKVYQIIDPLFSISDLFYFLSSFSLPIFSKFTSQVPLNWFTWFIVENDLRKEFNLISQVSPLLNEIITPESIDQIPITSFNSETLRLFAINTKKEHLVIWMINCLIESSSNSRLSAEEFSRILMGFDFSETRFELVYSALGKLFLDEILKPILFEFVTLKLVPRLVDENNALIWQLESSNKELQQIKEKEAELKRQEEERKAEEERNRPKFSACNKGSSITLSENDLVATHTGGYGSTNSFVAIQHPVKGKVVLQLVDFRNLNTFMGFFDSSKLQTHSCHSNSTALRVENGHIQFYINHPNKSGPSNPGGISRKQQIIIEFNNNQATFSVPALGYSHTVTWPSDYVFGLLMYDSFQSWSLDCAYLP
ncbi:hypothetical protein RCL1_005111 [Eukaryota sp. TZLM3-RCL]